MDKHIIFYINDGFADWECSFILPILKREGIRLHVVSDYAQKVKSAGGFTITPDGSLDNLFHHQGIDGIILPGGDFWMHTDPSDMVLDFVEKLDRQNKMIAAICAATVAIAKKGLLNHRFHTSNDLALLKASSRDYKGDKKYIKHELAVTDNNLITASGIGALEFTQEILEYLDIYTETQRRQWYDLFKRAVVPPPEFFNI